MLNNAAMNGNGAGVHASLARFVNITDCSVSDNQCGSGSGLFVVLGWLSELVLRSVIIEHNGWLNGEPGCLSVVAGAPTRGGGVFLTLLNGAVEHTTVQMHNVSINHNFASFGGAWLGWPGVGDNDWRPYLLFPSVFRGLACVSFFLFVLCFFLSVLLGGLFVDAMQPSAGSFACSHWGLVENEAATSGGAMYIGRDAALGLTVDRLFECALMVFNNSAGKHRRTCICIVHSTTRNTAACDHKEVATDAVRCCALTTFCWHSRHISWRSLGPMRRQPP